MAEKQERFEFEVDPIQSLVDAMSSLPFWDEGASLLVDVWVKANERGGRL